MDKKALLLTAVCSLLMTIGAPTAHAYISPEDLWGGSGGTGEVHPAAPDESLPPDRTNVSTTEAPAGGRDAEWAIAQQQLASQLRREAEQKELFGTGEEEEVMTAEEETDTSLGLFADDTQYDIRMARMEENDNGNVTIVIGSNGQVVTTSDGQVLHSGAPYVTATGPETVLMLMIFVLAGIGTFFYVHIRNKRFA